MGHGLLPAPSMRTVRWATVTGEMPAPPPHSWEGLGAAHTPAPHQAVTRVSLHQKPGHAADATTRRRHLPRQNAFLRWHFHPGDT